MSLYVNLTVMPLTQWLLLYMCTVVQYQYQYVKWKYLFLQVGIAPQDQQHVVIDSFVFMKLGIPSFTLWIIA